MKKWTSLLLLCMVCNGLWSQPRNTATVPGMNKFIDALMQKMTLAEKIGQLNLITPGGGVATGAVVSKDVEQKIKAGKVGGMFGVIGVDKIRQAQELVVNNSRLKIPMFSGSDVIHGYKTIFPIPLGLSFSLARALIERGAASASRNAE